MMFCNLGEIDTVLDNNFRYIHIVKSEQIFANKRPDRGHVFFFPTSD